MKLVQGDCLEVMKDIESESIDMILADLPYGTTTCKWDIVIPFDRLWNQYERVIKPNGAIVLFGSEPFSSYLRTSKIDLWKYDWIWDKVQPTGAFTAEKQPMKHRNLKFFSINDLMLLGAVFNTESKKPHTATNYLLWLDNLLRNEQRPKKTKRKMVKRTTAKMRSLARRKL